MESGVLDKGDIQKMQSSGASRTGLGSTAVVFIINNLSVHFIIFFLFMRPHNL